MANQYSFDLNSMWASAMYAASLNITVNATYAGSQLYTTVLQLSASMPRQPIEFPTDIQGAVRTLLTCQNGTCACRY